MFGAIFTGILHAEEGLNYAPRLPRGGHTLLLKTYEVRDSTNPQKNVGKYLSADFLILRSTNTALKEGDIRGWPWYIQGQGYTATFAQQNAKEFNEAILQSVNVAELPMTAEGQCFNPITNQVIMNYDPRTGAPIGPKTAHDAASIGELAVCGYFRGAQIAAEIVPAWDKKKNCERRGQDGKELNNANWKPVMGQSRADIEAMKAYLDANYPDAPPVTAQPAQTAAQPQNQQWPAAFQTQQVAQPAAQQPIVQTQVQTAAVPAATVPAAGGLSAMIAGLKKQGG